MTYGFDQASLEALPQQERNRVCKQIRQQQIENYLRFLAEEKKSPQPLSRPNKRNTSVQFGLNHQLQIAIETFDDKEVANLLNQGADVNFITANDSSLLHKCCMVGNLRAAQALLKNGAKVNAVDGDWWTPLHVACYHDYTDIVTLLLGNGADIMLLDIDGNFAFDHVMQDYDSYEVITEHRTKHGLNSALQVEIRRGRCENLQKSIQEGLNEGSEVNRRFEGGITWLHMASANGYKSVIKLLLNNGADINSEDDIGWTPLHVAAKYSQLKAVRMLLKHGANSSKPDYQGRRPVEIAGTEEIQKLILNARRDKQKSAESDDELDSKDIYVSKNIHPGDMSLSKTDKLMESQMRYAAESKPKHHGIDGPEEEEEDPIYVGAIWKVAESEEANLAETCDTDDLTTFSTLTEKTIVETLQTRYADKLIYTYIGDILIALNPFKQLPYYAKTISNRYHECTHLPSLSPHVYAVAEQARRQLMVGQTSQCCMISGESGAGKTESCKFLVQHLLRVSGSSECGLSSKINQVNPLLEAFGNARTVMNGNSSRFAKFLEVSYTNQGVVVGAQLSEYLLEKSRLVHQGPGERNFHIFYWMLSGITPEEASSCLFEKGFRFRYLEGDGMDIKGKLRSADKRKFWDVKDCLEFVGFAKEDLSGLMTTLAAVLHLGNVKFVSIKDGQACDVENYDVLTKVCKLLRVEFGELRISLVQESILARGEELHRPLTTTQAEESRDALAKALYSRLFSWIVNGINNTIQPVEPDPENLSIAILDIFGFENMKSNGFEQICINLANEQLQMFFNERVFQQEQQDCLVEGVPVIDVYFPTNQDVISLFLEKNIGILALLDEESTLLTSTDRTLATKLHQGPGEKYPSVYKTPRDKGPSLTIVHYAGSISYNLQGMLDKNRDTLRPSLAFSMRSSTSLLIKDLFQASVDKTGSLKPSTRQLSLQREISFRRQFKTSKPPFDFFKKLKMSPKQENDKRRAMLTATGTTRKGPSTMAYQFRNSLNDMMGKLQKSQPHFIRCIKPNASQTPMELTPEYVRAQLLYTGVLETVKIRKHGYALRIAFAGFLFRYRSLDLMINTLSKGMSSPVQACQDILRHYSITNYKLGKTKIFLHQVHLEALDEKVLDIQRKVIKCQTTIRGFNARRTRRRLSSQHIDEDQQVINFTLEVESSSHLLCDWLTDTSQHDSNKVTINLQREASKSLEALDELLNIYEMGGEIDTIGLKTSQSESKLILDPVLPQESDDVFVGGNVRQDPDSVYDVIPADSGVEEGEDESYQDALSLSSGGTVTSLPEGPPPPPPGMDPRHFPPSPRDMYQGFYATITDNGHKVDKRHPPSVPERAPDTRLSTFSPRSSSTSSGIYNEPDVYEGGSHNQWPTSPSSPSSHPSQTHWQPSSPSSPRLLSKLVHGQQPGSPRHENRPFSYFTPKQGQGQGQGQCNGTHVNGQRTRTGSTGSANSVDNTYARWIHLDQAESDLPPWPAEGQPTYQQLHCVPNSGYNTHNSSSAYGVVRSPQSPGASRVTPCAPPVPPPNPCQGGPPPTVTSQIQQLKNNAIASPKTQQKAPGSPKMSSKLKSLMAGPQIPELPQRMDSQVPPPPNFPAPPPPVSPQDRYQAVVQTTTRGRSPSPPPPPPPLDGAKGGSRVPPPPPPISTIPNAKASKSREKEVRAASPRLNGNSAPQNGTEINPTHLAAEIGNIKLKRVNSPQANVAPIQSMADTGSTGQLNFRLRPTPGAVDIYKEGRDDTTKDTEELPPPPPPPQEPEPEPDPEPRPVAVVTAQPHEPKKSAQANKGKTKERSPQPYNMDLVIPDDIDINQVPGVIPVTKDTPNWKREMQEKKNREKIEEYVRKILREREEQAKWRDVPEWKRKILMRKSAEEQEAAIASMKAEEPKSSAKKAPPVERPNSAECGVPKGNANITPAAMQMDPAELESMPPWKRELLFKREKVPMTFFNEFNPEDEEEAPPS